MLNQNEKKEFPRFTPEEINDLKKRFSKASKKTNRINREDFKNHLGLLGIESDTFLSDRIFMMLDEDKNGNINFEEFLKYLDIVLNGSQEEKAEWTFKLIDCHNKGFFEKNDLAELMKLTVDTWSFMTENKIIGKNKEKMEKYISNVFLKLDMSKNGKVTLENFKICWKKDPNFLEICEFLNRGFTQQEIPTSFNSLNNNDFIANKFEKIIQEIENIIVIVNEGLKNNKKDKDKDKFQNDSIINCPKPILMNIEEDNFGKSSFECLETENSETNGLLQSLKKIKHMIKNLQNNIENSTKDAESKPLRSHFQLSNSNLKNSFNEDNYNMKELMDIKDEIVLRHKVKKITHNIKPNIIKRPNKSVLFVFDGNYKLVLNMMLGIQNAVKSIEITPDYNLSEKDFKFSYFFEVISKRKLENSETCIFYDYSPHVFYKIRNNNNINNSNYLQSIGTEKIITDLIKGNIGTLSELVTTGKSGSLFYYTIDGKYTLKTIKFQEFKFLKKILFNYYNHLNDNPFSFINKLYGMHKIKIKHKNFIYNKVIFFVVMENIFNTDLELSVKYDLKGSTYKRETKNTNNSKIAKKDQNAIKDHLTMEIKTNDYEIFIDQLNKDLNFFKNNNIIDYSFIIGIHDFTMSDSLLFDFSENSSGFKNKKNRILVCEKNKKIYFLGIIDILTEYNWIKKFEYNFKRLAFGPDISAIPTIMYADRFANFLKKILLNKSC